MDFPALQGKGVIGHFDIYLASGLSTTLNCSKDLWFIPAVWIEAAWDGSARSGTWSKVEFSIVWYSLYNFASLNQCPQAHQLKEQFLICCLPPFFFFQREKVETTCCLSQSCFNVELSAFMFSWDNWTSRCTLERNVELITSLTYWLEALNHCIVVVAVQIYFVCFFSARNSGSKGRNRLWAKGNWTRGEYHALSDTVRAATS